MGLFSKKPERDLILVVDVQSSIVRFTLLGIMADELPNILLVHTVATPYKPHAGSGYLVKITIRAITQALNDILRALHAGISSGRFVGVRHRISAVHYVLSSPWIVSQAKTLSMSFDHETRLTKEKISDTILKERLKMGGDSADLVAIEEKVFDVRLNGYSVSSWEGMTAKSADVSFVTSIASSKMIDRFKDVVKHHIGGHHIYFHSSLLLQNIGIQKIMPGSGAYTLIHVHGELTDVVVVNRHSCVFFGSFPLGVRGIIRKIAHAARTDEHTAESSLVLHLGKQFDMSHGKGLDGIINDVEKGWTSELSRLFAEGELADTLPVQTIISAHAHEGFFVRAFEKAYPGSKVRLLEMEEIEPFVKWSERTEKSVVPALSAVALHTILHG